ncbi:hypothetical protein CLOM_g20544 [Closterium sp. NIES-68]|nr:hypothetical protein CLOM_g20544 [Closterium sp. NIES-68]
MWHARRATETMAGMMQSVHSAQLCSLSLSTMPYAPLRECSEAALELALAALRAQPARVPGSATDPRLLAGLRQVSASVDSVSIVDLIGGLASTLQVLVGYQADMLEEVGVHELVGRNPQALRRAWNMPCPHADHSSAGSSCKGVVRRRYDTRLPMQQESRRALVWGP